MRFVLLITMSIFASIAVYAQALTDSVSDSFAFDQIMQIFQGPHLAGLALVAAVVQSLMLILRTEFVISRFGSASASVRLALVFLFSTIGGVVQLMSNGMTLHAALLHSTTLAAYQVLGHQLYTVYLEKKQVKI